MSGIKGTAPGISSFVGAAGQIVTGSIQEDLFIRGRSFSYEDWLVYAADEIKTFVFDPIACTCDQIVFQPFAFSAQSGPIEIGIFAPVTADDDGTLLGASNRRATSPIIPEGILRLNPSNIVKPADRFAGDLVPASGTAPANSSGAENTQGLPFEIIPSIKYALTVKNTDGAGVRIQFKTTWFEIFF